MVRSRYPFAPAGRFAALAFAVGALVVGFLVVAAKIVAAGDYVLPVLWAAVAAGTAYFVFGSQGPVRPPSVTQAAAADGVVAGATSGGVGALIWIIAASGFGASSSTSLSAGQTVLTLFAGLFFGGAGGALLGLAALAAGGDERFARTPAKRASTKASKRKRSRRR